MGNNRAVGFRFHFSPRFYCGALLAACGLLLCFAAAAPVEPMNGVAVPSTGSNVFVWSTNGSAVFAYHRILSTNVPLGVRIYATNHPGFDVSKYQQVTAITNKLFDHFVPASLHHLVWTNFLAHTNGRTTSIWSIRAHPKDWPAQAPLVVWDTHCLTWGMQGITALSPCWEQEGGPGQRPITALTRRHGYTRGHGMGADGYGTHFAGKKVWFFTTNNTPVQVKVLREVIRTWGGTGRGDYTLLLFDQDLPMPITPMRVIAWTNLLAKYSPQPSAPWLVYETEQGGHVSAEVPGLRVETWKGGDSGSPNMLPLPNELLFISGRSTSNCSPAMQADIDALCRMEGLNPQQYQLQWAELAEYPTY